MNDKVCPVILRQQNGQTQILVFSHPQAGIQLVKGGLEQSETEEQGALRELYEESGLRAKALRVLGRFEVTQPHQIWHAVLCQLNQPAPETWTHKTQDDGGHDFEFHWHNLYIEADERWHTIFKQALHAIRRCLRNDRSKENSVLALRRLSVA